MSAFGSRMTNLQSYGEDVTGSVDIRSFGDLQARLRAMQYNEPVGVDSAPLVKRLLTDVVHGSERIDALQNELEKAQREAIELSQIILPLRKENAKLTRENNSLHLEIIHQEEAISERERKCDLQLEQLKDDIARLQFTNNQRAQSLSQKDAEIAKLHAQLERLLATGAAGRSQQPGMEMRGGPLRLSQSFSATSRGLMQSSILDKSAVDDAAVVSELQAQLRDVKTELRDAEQETKALWDRLQHREQEIERLAKLTVDRAASSVPGEPSTRPTIATTSAAASYRTVDEETTELQIEQLSAQVDLLNSQVAKYESRLKSANEQLKRSTALEQKLQKTEQFAQQVEKENAALQSKYLALQMENVKLGGAAVTRDPQSTHENPPTNTDQDTIHELQQRIAAVTAQNERLEDALRATHHDNQSYTAALSSAASQNRELSSDLHRSETKASEVASNAAKTQQRLADATARVEVQARELEVLRASLQQVEQTRAIESEKNGALHRELRTMDKVLSQRDEECRSLQSEMAAQRRELDRVNARLEALKKSVENGESSGDNGSSKKKTALYAQEMKWLEDERRELRQSREELMAKVLKLEDALQTATMELQTVTLEKEDVENQLAVMTKREQVAAEQVDTKRQEVLALQKELMQWKESAQHKEEELSRSRVLLERADHVENDKIRATNELLELRRRTEELRDENAALKHSAESNERHAARLQAQLYELQEKLAVAQRTSLSLEKEQLELSRSYESATLELRNARQLSQHYQGEYEKLMQELSDAQHSRSSEHSALQHSAVHLSEFKTQLRQVQSELSMKQAALHATETRLEQEKVQVKTLQSQLVLAQDETLQLKEVNRAMEINLRQLREDLTAKDKALTAKTESNESARLLVEQMETARDQLLFKLKQEQQQTQRHQLENEELQSKLRGADVTVKKLENEVASLKKLTRTLDTEKDRVHDQLDLLTERFHDLSEQNATLQREASEANAAVKTHQENMAQLVEKLRKQEQLAQDLELRVQQLDHELETLRHGKAMSDAELRALAQDLENMTIENQALSEECSRLQLATHRGDASSHGLKSQLREVEKQRDILNVELEDAQQVYRSLVQEHEGTAKALQHASAKCDELATKNDAIQGQLTTLQNDIEVLRQKNATLATESSAYREQISFLTDKLQSADASLRDAEHKFQRAVEELEAQKNVSHEISAQRYGAQAQNAAVAQRVVHLEAKLSTVQYEAKTLQEKLQAEASQRRSVEEVVVTLRQQLAARDSQIAHLEEQREAMADEIRLTHQRLVAKHDAMMDMSELAHGSPSFSVSRASSGEVREQNKENAVDDYSSPKTTDGSPTILPLRALEMAQRKCKELEERLAHQDDTIQQLERSRSKFKRFAAKYEREIETRDRMIDELRSSRASSSAFPSPPSAVGAMGQSARSSSSPSSSRR